MTGWTPEPSLIYWVEAESKILSIKGRQPVYRIDKFVRYTTLECLQEVRSLQAWIHKWRLFRQKDPVSEDSL